MNTKPEEMAPEAGSVRQHNRSGEVGAIAENNCVPQSNDGYKVRGYWGRKLKLPLTQ